MKRSVLLQLVRDSMLEVLQACRRIDKAALLEHYPVLASPINVKVEIFLKNEAFSAYTTQNENKLLENIIYAAKKAAFETDKEHILTSTQFLYCEIELTLYTPEGTMSERDKPLLDEKENLL